MKKSVLVKILFFSSLFLVSCKPTIPTIYDQFCQQFGFENATDFHYVTDISPFVDKLECDGFVILEVNDTRCCVQEDKFGDCQEQERCLLPVIQKVRKNED